MSKDWRSWLPNVESTQRKKIKDEISQRQKLLNIEKLNVEWANVENLQLCVTVYFRDIGKFVKYWKSFPIFYCIQYKVISIKD
jgi:hypothetical protein